MKTLRTFLFITVALFASFRASAANVTVNSMPGAVADFHPVFAGNSGNVGSFSVNTGTGSAPFTVVVDKKYDVTKVVNGVVTVIGTVSWDASANATYTPAP